MSGPFSPKEALPFVVFKVSMGFNWPSTWGELQMKVWRVICASGNDPFSIWGWELSPISTIDAYPIHQCQPPV
ncbi:hypothetical protein TNCT_186761 [Trichonephila clavata]|uniref:Uncharacterized protein n=1 Tax=Trichonephila clavata TaxID=2740835 RepID=A0A8X6HGZ2_TRICU|nr:hypothetical protein TNCT_186761 [Trichonephila clavata]